MLEEIRGELAERQAMLSRARAAVAAMDGIRLRGG